MKKQLNLKVSIQVTMSVSVGMLT